MDNYALGNFHVHDGCLRFKVKGSITASIDDIAVIGADGYLTYGSVATGLAMVGTFAEAVNTAGLSDGDPFGDYARTGPMVNVNLDRRLFWFDNASGGDAVDQATIKQTVYINGRRSVTKTSTGRSVAGKAVQLSTDGTKVLVAIPVLSA